MSQLVNIVEVDAGLEPKIYFHVNKYDTKQ